jgi:hypothetical protein
MSAEAYDVPVSSHAGVGLGLVAGRTTIFAQLQRFRDQQLGQN